MFTCDQGELPFDNGGFTQTIEALLAHALIRKSIRPRRASKPCLKGIDLNQSLLPMDVVFGIEQAWTPPAATETKAPPIEAVLYTMDNVPDSFELPTFETIAMIAAKLLYSELKTLFYSRGNAKVKKEIIDWFFADAYYHAGYKARKPMHEIPFTAQFCCMVEEIDYQLLCEALHDQVEDLRERQESVELVAPININTTEVPTYGYQDNKGTLWSSVGDHH